ncbi:hypothetical protein P1X14_14585 [Sphingomonas sp. AOB5]|nr:hypothetical protein [Sphingomonas sp. AOB5]
MALVLTGAQDPEPFTWNLATSLSPEALERRVLQAPQGTTRETEVTNVHTRVFNFDRVAFEVAFAAAPAATQYPGLCSAEVQVASFGPGGANVGGDTPVRLLMLVPSQRFAVSAADLAAGKAPTDETCKSLGPVVRRVKHPLRYFAAYGDGSWELDALDASIAIQSIRRLIPSNAPQFRCEEDGFAQFFKDIAPLCSDRNGVMAALDWTTLSHLSLRSCGERCAQIKAIFDRPAAPTSAMKVHVELSVHGIRVVNGKLENPGEIGPAWITGVFHVD